jgi:hypothetical protein
VKSSDLQLRIAKHVIRMQELRFWLRVFQVRSLAYSLTQTNCIIDKFNPEKKVTAAGIPSTRMLIFLRQQHPLRFPTEIELKKAKSAYTLTFVTHPIWAILAGRHCLPSSRRVTFRSMSRPQHCNLPQKFLFRKFWISENI